MKRFAPVATAAALAVAAAGSAAAAPRASTLCVGNGPPCFPTLAAALAAAHNGDTVQLRPGTYAGGVTIDRSIRLVGAGAGQTTISGGGPVLTIGAYGAASEPTVSIDGVTVTGGVTRSSPESVPLTGEEGVYALGGGIEIPANADSMGGATVTITNSVITGNRVAPYATVPSAHAVCPGGPCPKAWAKGGGIDNWGTLTLEGTMISNNRVGAAAGLSNVAADAEAGAIDNELSAGPLTISNSVISGNQTSASAPNGRFAGSGGIFVEGSTLTMSNSSVTNNSATLNAAWPNSVDTQAVAGGIHLGDNATGGSIRNTTVSGNTVTMTNSVGDANAFSGGVHTDGNPLPLSNDVVTNNSVTVATIGGSTGNAAGDSGAGEWAGTITNTRVTGNSVFASSVAGDAGADAGASVFDGSLNNSVISDNHIQASSPNGTAIDRGGAFVVSGTTTLRNTTVSRNTAETTGLSGFARGGGLLDDDQSANGGPAGGALTLINSSITGNALSGRAGISLLGGGIYASIPVFLTNSLIANNTPDQCAGGGC